MLKISEKIGNIALSILIVLFSLIITACSPSDGIDSDSFESDEQYIDSNEDLTEVIDSDGSEPSLAKQGWVPATMTLHFRLEQQADLAHQQADITAEGNWRILMDATQTEQVWVQEDFSKAVVMADTEFENEPFEYTEDSANTAQSTLRYSLDSRMNSRDISIDQQVSGNGTISELQIFNMHPSLYGDGYQFDFKVHWQASVSGQQIASTAGRDTSTDLGQSYDTVTSFSLFPNPGQTPQNYPYLDPNDSEELNRTKRTNEQNFLASSHTILANESFVLQGIRVGAVTRFEDNRRLNIQYAYNNGKQVRSFEFADVELQALIPAQPEINQLLIDVDIVKNDQP